MGKPTFEDWNSEALVSDTRLRLRISSFHMKVFGPEYIDIKG